jgi:hypothetical protein
MSWNRWKMHGDEYIAKGGNGSFVKYWYDEEKELETPIRDKRSVGVIRKLTLYPFD